MAEQAGALPRPRNRVQEQYGRDLKIIAPFDWLRAGARDFFRSPLASLSYGLFVFAISIGFIVGLYEFGFSYVLLPSIAGFMVIGPMIAIGLYEKSRLLAEGASLVGVKQMLRVRAKSPVQLLFIGVFMLLVMLFWLRTAILLFALFYGLDPFVGLQETIDTLFFTSKGQTLLLVGSLIGAALAALAFSLTAFSIPMLMVEDKDTITAMVLSLVMAWCNKPVALVWGVMVVSLFLLCVVTGFLGLIVIFPILGHATWHAYRAIRGEIPKPD